VKSSSAKGSRIVAQENAQVSYALQSKAWKVGFGHEGNGGSLQGVVVQPQA
jgi:hypothetical protein